MMAQKISVPANTISKAIEARYRKLELQASLSITKQTLKAPFTPKPAMMVNTMNHTLSKETVIPIIPMVVMPQLYSRVLRLPMWS
jgi:hypothetical protein